MKEYGKVRCWKWPIPREVGQNFAATIKVEWPKCLNIGHVARLCQTNNEKIWRGSRNNQMIKYIDAGTENEDDQVEFFISKVKNQRCRAYMENWWSMADKIRDKGREKNVWNWLQSIITTCGANYTKPTLECYVPMSTH